jgi:hypothetical protein
VTKPLAMVVGSIGKLPFAGMSLYNLHYIAGLQELGFDIHYVERQNEAEKCYDPLAGTFTDDERYALRYLAAVLPQLGIDPERLSFLDRRNRCHGSGWAGLREALNRAEFVLTLADPTWFEELERCPRRAFVDGDPMFTQIRILEGEKCWADAILHYDTLFTYATRIGMADCLVPTAGRTWIPTRPVVATRLWNAPPPDGHPPVTTLMNWGAWNDMTDNGPTFGHENREFQRFIDLPQRTSQTFVLAAAGSAPTNELSEHGWHLVDPVATTITIETYRRFITGSRADFSVAKHTSVASSSGWFSDRSTCYLASGRPVLHQNTGCGDWLPAGEGVLLFSSVDEALDGIRQLDADYERHARAARALAKENFEAATVIGRMLDDAGFR